MLALWIVVIALGILELFETVMLVLLLRAFGEIRQKGFLAPTADVEYPDIGGLAVGQIAPPFLATTYEGEFVKLEDFKGRRLVLAFISPGCSACAGAIKVLNEMMQQKKNYTFVAIGGGDGELNKAYAIEHKAQMPILTPQSNFEKDEYQTPMIPFVFLLDETGVIRARGPVNHRGHLQNLLTVAFAIVDREQVRN